MLNEIHPSNIAPNLIKEVSEELLNQNFPKKKCFGEPSGQDSKRYKTSLSAISGVIARWETDENFPYEPMIRSNKRFMGGKGWGGGGTAAHN